MPRHPPGAWQSGSGRRRRWNRSNSAPEPGSRDSGLSGETTTSEPWVGGRRPVCIGSVDASVTVRYCNRPKRTNEASARDRVLRPSCRRQRFTPAVSPTGVVSGQPLYMRRAVSASAANGRLGTRSRLTVSSGKTVVRWAEPRRGSGTTVGCGGATVDGPAGQRHCVTIHDGDRPSLHPIVVPTHR